MASQSGALQQNGGETPAGAQQQQGQSAPTSQQQAGNPVFRDWAAI